MNGKQGTAKRFEDLWIWDQARSLVREVYTDFGGGKPSERDFGFNDQIRRAAISVMNNIAEGFKRNSDADFSRFLVIAKASCGELRSMYYIAEDQKYIDASEAEARRCHARETASGISSLIDHLKARK